MLPSALLKICYLLHNTKVLTFCITQKLPVSGSRVALVRSIVTSATTRTPLAAKSIQNITRLEILPLLQLKSDWEQRGWPAIYTQTKQGLGTRIARAHMILWMVYSLYWLLKSCVIIEGVCLSENLTHLNELPTSGCDCVYTIKYETNFRLFGKQK